MKGILNLNKDVEKEQTEAFLKEYRELVLKYKRDIRANLEIVRIELQPTITEQLTKK